MGEVGFSQRSGEGLEQAPCGWAQGMTQCKGLPAVAMDVAGSTCPEHRCLIPAWSPLLALHWNVEASAGPCHSPCVTA